MAPTRRDAKFQIRLTEEEREMLEALSERAGLSASDKVRQLIRAEFNVCAEALMQHASAKLKHAFATGNHAEVATWMRRHNTAGEKRDEFRVGRATRAKNQKT